MRQPKAALKKEYTYIVIVSPIESKIQNFEQRKKRFQFLNQKRKIIKIPKTQCKTPL